jgi:hypothetical protein
MSVVAFAGTGILWRRKTMAENNPTLTEALAELQERKNLKSDDFHEGVSEEQLQEANAALPYPIPAAWQEALKISNGFFVGSVWFSDVIEITPPDENVMDHIQEAAPIGSLIVAMTPSGDVFCLDVAHQTAEGDCPTVWTNHEGEPDNWPSIPAMLLHFIAEDRSHDDVTLKI